MIEDLNDVISILLLLSIPVTAIIYLLSKKLRRKKDKVLTTSEKYYREW